MKASLLLVALVTLAAVALPAPAADKKDEKKDRKEKKEDKKKDEKKEEVRNSFEVTIEGAKDASAEADIKIYLGSIEGVRVDKYEKTDKGMAAVLSTLTKVTRGDLAKVLKDNKDLKVSDFKAVRPSRDKKDEKKSP